MRAAAAKLGITVDERQSERSVEKAIAIAQQFLSERPLPDYLIATNDVGACGEIIKLADAAGVPLILLNNDLERSNGRSTASRALNIGTGSAVWCPTTRAAATG